MSNTASLSVRRERKEEVKFAFGVSAKGNVQVLANGKAVIEFTAEGYLRRIKGALVPPGAHGLRALPDGRVAIKKRKNGARA